MSVYSDFDKKTKYPKKAQKKAKQLGFKYVSEAFESLYLEGRTFLDVSKIMEVKPELVSVLLKNLGTEIRPMGSHRKGRRIRYVSKELLDRYGFYEEIDLLIDLYHRTHSVRQVSNLTGLAPTTIYDRFRRHGFKVERMQTKRKRQIEKKIRKETKTDSKKKEYLGVKFEKIIDKYIVSDNRKGYEQIIGMTKDHDMAAEAYNEHVVKNFGYAEYVNVIGSPGEVDLALNCY